MLRLILNDEHLAGALEEALTACRHRLFITTADVKDLYLTMTARNAPASGNNARIGKRKAPGRRTGRSQSILDVFRSLSKSGIEVRLLHSGVPSGPFLEDLKKGVPKGLIMRRCPRVHAKAVIADGRLMYLGSANLTGAGLGAKTLAAETSRRASGRTRSP